MIAGSLMHGVGAAAICVLCVLTAGAQQGTRPIAIRDMARLREVSDPHLSPSGEWITYTVSGTDSAHDRANGDIWLARGDGTRAVRMT